MPKVKTFKTNFSIQKIRKRKPLKQITILINTFHGKQDHTFTKIYKFYNRITTRVLIRPVKIASGIHVYAERFGCKKNSLLIEIPANLRPFEGLKSSKTKIKTFNDF